jgi:hypothetical protein
MQSIQNKYEFSELSFMKEQLDRTSLKEGGSISLYPFMARKKKIKLLRTVIDFTTDNIKAVDRAMSHYGLGRVNKEKLHFRLMQVESFDQRKMASKRYILTSLCKVPFKLNGQFTFKAYLEAGDKVEMGYNSLQVEVESDSKELGYF